MIVIDHKGAGVLRSTSALIRHRRIVLQWSIQEINLKITSPLLHEEPPACKITDY
jgi:hypothetical protein